MKMLTICLLTLLLISTLVGCFLATPTATPPLKIALDDCDVMITDRITGQVYFTTKPYYSQLDSSRIKIKAGYKQLRNAMGTRIGTKPFDTPIILSGNWRLEGVQ